MNTKTQFERGLTSEELRQELSHCYGTDDYFKNTLNPCIIHTEGFQVFLENAGSGAYWLLNILVTEPAILATQEEFASITLTVKGSKANLVVTDGNSNTPTYQRHIDYTDCPEGEWQFFMYQNTLMLTTEY